MNLCLQPWAVVETPPPGEPHVLLVVADPRTRYALADLLLEAGFRLTLASSFGVADLMLDDEAGSVDLLMTAEAVEEMAGFGSAQLARAVRPELPVLVLDEEAASGPGVLEAASRAMRRWPVRERAAPLLQ
jgi:DNA-binding NtrC family response regulator